MATFQQLKGNLLALGIGLVINHALVLGSFFHVYAYMFGDKIIDTQLLMEGLSK